MATSIEFSLEPTITPEYIQAVRTIADFHKELTLTYTALADYLEKFSQEQKKSDEEAPAS